MFKFDAFYDFPMPTWSLPLTAYLSLKAAPKWPSNQTARMSSHNTIPNILWFADS